MSLDTLLGTSWTIHSLDAVPLPAELQSHLRSQSAPDTIRYWRELGDQLYEHILHHSRSLKDDFDTESKKRGHLTACDWTLIRSINADTDLKDRVPPLGFLIEIKYSKTTHRIVLVIGYTPHTPNNPTTGLERPTDITNHFQIIRLLAKCPASHLKHVLRFLDQSFRLNSEDSIIQQHLSSSTILTACARYLSHCDTVDENELLRQALIRRSIGDLKIGVTVSAPEVAAKLKTVDVDVPADTVVTLLGEARKNGSGFLDELAKHLHLRTGLRLPLDVRAEASESLEAPAPWQVSKIACSAFALGTDGRMKLGRKPIDGAEVLGVGGKLLLNAAHEVFDVMCKGKE